MHPFLNRDLKKVQGMTQKQAYKMFEFICENEIKGIKLACRDLREDICFTAEIIDKDGKVI